MKHGVANQIGATVGRWTLPFKSSRLVGFIPKMHNYAEISPFSFIIVFEKKIPSPKPVVVGIVYWGSLHSYL